MMMIQCFLFLVFFSFSPQMPIVQSKCNHPTELSALIQFKDSFQINCDNYFDDGHHLGYPKTSLWDYTERLLNGTIEWDGVQCDSVSGHVIGLDLSSSCLQGSINSNNNIFNRLIHLEHLNLAFNYFQGSSFPSELCNLSRLTYLNLSSSAFGGHVPLEMSKLFMLTSLDLSYNVLLELNLKSLVRNLTNLEELDLSWMYFVRTEVPKFLFPNTSSLRSLKLDSRGLYGEFPQGIFYLPKLQHLRIAYNEELKGHIPTDFNSSATPLLESLVLAGTNFSGTIPDSIGNLVLLRELDLSSCKFSGPIPDSLGKLTNLKVLNLARANLIGEIPSSLANLPNLSSLDLSRNTLNGQIPSVLSNLTQLSVMRLAYNQLTGEIPLGFVNLTKLVHLDLNNNILDGSLPIWSLTGLEILDVGENKLSDTLELDMLLEFSNLYDLVLSSNNITLLQKRNVSISSRLPKFIRLGLSSCRLSKLPEFLLHQQELSYLDLSRNSIQGSYPKWMESIESLFYIDLSDNLITSFDDPQLFLRRPNLVYIDISFNKLRGSIPAPSPSIMTYRASNNELNGEIPHSFCNLSSLQVLDLSTNRLSGELDPHCFIKSSLMALNLRNNSFHGKIPEFCTSGTYSLMMMINLNTNQFQGKIPRSLANCVMLEFFDAGSNFINDTFPYWLGSLPQLKVFILKDNALHGSIGNRSSGNMSSGHWFPELTIIDLSRNRLSGNLTSWHFEKWMAMKNTNFKNRTYMRQNMTGFLVDAFYDYSLRLYNKGSEIEYPKVLDALVGIDLSSNQFEGEIPTTIGDLRGLRLLNLFNNHLSGVIPSSLGNLTQMESLDLSANWLSGQIPQQLIEMIFLSTFNVSHNNLTGLIPQRRQFNTFTNTSYLDNPGLCGEPLSRKCETSGQQDAQTPDEITKKTGNFWEDLNAKILWMVVSIGFGGGLFIGVAVENVVDWRMLILSWWMNRIWSRSSRRNVRRN